MKTKLTVLLLTILLYGCGGDNHSDSSSDDKDTSLKTISIPTSEGVFDGLSQGSSKATPVLLLHGFPTTADQYIHIMNDLVDEGYYVIAPNLRGFSENVRPENPDAYHPSHRTEDVIKIADALGIYRFHLVGHDSGALTAWIIASMYPDRVITLTAISVPHPQALIDGIFDEVVYEYEFENPNRNPRGGYVEDFRSEGFEETFVENNHEYMRWLLEDTPDASKELYIEKLGDVDTIRKILNYYRSRDWIWILENGSNSINVPTLQIWSDLDSYVSYNSMSRSENYVTEEYRFEILANVSHWITETAPEEVSPLLIDHFRGRY